MTEQEKELVEIITRDTGWLIKVKAIIARYPQICKKPVRIETFKDTGEAQLVCDYEIANELERYKNEFYVEVIS